VIDQGSSGTGVAAYSQNAKGGATVILLSPTVVNFLSGTASAPRVAGCGQTMVTWVASGFFAI
jgi:hypothetical protein